jgi:hypothetical protein
VIKALPRIQDLFIVSKGYSIIVNHDDAQSAKMNKNDPGKVVDKFIKKKEGF